MTNKKTVPSRIDLEQIKAWIPAYANVLDLGCGDGQLLYDLQKEKKVRGVGVEILDANIKKCVDKGVSVIQQNLEEGLALFERDTFDVAILSQTLQSVKNTEAILFEMKRVAKKGIISFPNFGYWKHAVSLLMGKMPIHKQMPYEWYNTPNIHLCTLDDFEILARKVGLKIEKRATFYDQTEVEWLANLRATLAVYYFTNG